MTTSTLLKDRPVRSFASHTPKWQRFQNKVSLSGGSNNKNVKASEKEVVPYQRQYSHVYSFRLAALKDGCWKKLNAVSSKSKPVNRILELKEDEPSSVVGTIIVESLNGNSEDNYYGDDEDAGEDRQLHPDAFCRSCDQLFLEDESGRVALKFAKDKPFFAYQYCTGVVVGVQGTVDARGIMHVQNVVTPALGPIASPTIPENADTAPHLLLVSSLNCGDPGVSSLPRELLVSYLQGHFGEASKKVARIVVAGSGPGSVDPAMGLKEFDLFGIEVTRTAGLPLDILPSAQDPTTRNWPQRPLHSSLLPHTLRASKEADNNTPMTRLTPNPYQALIGNQMVLGTDGLNVRDLQKYILKPPTDDQDSPLKLNELEALEQTFQWAHICPTAPNSPEIGLVPSGDPMAMTKQAPNLYFCGNSEAFATKLLSHETENAQTRLVCVPKFSETGEAVLVNLHTLGVEVLRFSKPQDKSD